MDANVKILYKKVKSADGTSIGYQVMGRGDRVIVLCNGLGGFVHAWSPLYTYFGDTYRFISWDYRGLLHSDPPADESHMTMEDHNQDLDAILAKEKVSTALIAGWSMGVQVCLEYYRRRASFFSAIILLNGTSGYPFHTALNNPLSKYVLPKLNELAQRVIPAVQPTLKPLANRLIDWQGFLKIICNLGLVHETLNHEVFKEVAKEMISADMHYYHEIMKYLSQHDASDILPQVKVPTLVIAGDGDKITPLKTAEKMAEQIPGAQFFVIPKGTHYSILEFPDLFNHRVEQFLNEHYPASQAPLKGHRLDRALGMG